MRLNLGAGGHKLPGFENWDRATGQEAYPLAVSDVEEIRASHILEHFSHREVPAVLADWVRALKPGGRLAIAVPDFEYIARAYLSGEHIPTEGYLMGGHVDQNDRHGAIFDEETLADLMRRAGLFGITRWRSSVQDCASLPVSLNLCGHKAPAAWPKVAAVMSVPRLGFMDNFFSAFEALHPLRIPLRKCTGAFWGQCLTRAIEQTLEGDDPDYILTIDYDSVYSRNDVEALMFAAMRNPDAAAIAPLQASRSRSTPLMTLRGPDGKTRSQVLREELATELVKAATAHFGLTLIKRETFERIARPWFIGSPGVEARWGEDRVDDDIHFWRQLEAARLELFVCPRVAIGHAELMVRWPDRDLTAMYQHPSEYFAQGKPEGVWK